MLNRRLFLTSALAAGCSLPALLRASAQEKPFVIGERRILNKGLVAVGRMPANLRDRMGETFGSGSGLALDPKDWRRTGDIYEGALWLLPDRGYNVEGTVDYSARIHRLNLKISPVAPGTRPQAGEEQKGIEASLVDTLMLKDMNGRALTGLDPVAVRPADARFPALPLSADGKISVDTEALVLLADGTFLIGDEYAPAIYRFSKDGELIGATRPPEAFSPIRKGELNFSSNNPGPTAPKPEPANPERGRTNNQGFEGLSLAPDGRTLTVMLQSAMRQDGGDSFFTRRYTRALTYDGGDPAQLKLTGEYVVPLPVFKDNEGRMQVAAQSELLSLGNGLHLLLCRDSNNGQSLKSATSLYRSIELLDLNGATNIAGTDYDALKPVAPKGELDPAITPARLTPFIDLNGSDDLARFGLHNGEPNDANNLSEKWESMALLPAMDASAPDDYLLLVANDNDFVTRTGYQVGAAYDAGADVDTMLMAWRITVPRN